MEILELGLVRPTMSGSYTQWVFASGSFAFFFLLSSSSNCITPYTNIDALDLSFLLNCHFKGQEFIMLYIFTIRTIGCTITWKLQWLINLNNVTIYNCSSMFLETINHGSNKLSANTALFDACILFVYYSV